MGFIFKGDNMFTIDLYSQPFPLRRVGGTVVEFTACMYDEDANRLCEFYTHDDALLVAEALNARVFRSL